MGFLSFNARSVGVAFRALFLRDGVATFAAGPAFFFVTLSDARGLLRVAQPKLLTSAVREALSDSRRRNPLASRGCPCIGQARVQRHTRNGVMEERGTLSLSNLSSPK